MPVPVLVLLEPLKEIDMSKTTTTVDLVISFPSLSMSNLVQLIDSINDLNTDYEINKMELKMPPKIKNIKTK